MSTGGGEGIVHQPLSTHFLYLLFLYGRIADARGGEAALADGGLCGMK